MDVWDVRRGLCSRLALQMPLLHEGNVCGVDFDPSIVSHVVRRQRWASRGIYIGLEMATSMYKPGDLESSHESISSTRFQDGRHRTSVWSIDVLEGQQRLSSA